MCCGATAALHTIHLCARGRTYAVLVCPGLGGVLPSWTWVDPWWSAHLQVPEEDDAADVLGLTASTPDGVIALLQLPPLMPSVTLFEAAERAAVEAPTAESQPLPDGVKPKPKFQKGPDLLKALPSGKVLSARSPCIQSTTSSCHGSDYVISP